MNHEQAWQLIHKAFDGISGFTPPQVRQMDQAFQSWAQLVMQDKEMREKASRAKPVASKHSKKGAESLSTPDPP